MKRAALVLIVALGWPVLAAAPASAHGIGGGLDLPMPLPYFVVATGVVLLVTFSALAVAWPAPRWQTPSPGRPLVSWGRWVVMGLMAIGLVGLGLVVVAGIFGEDRRTNAAPTFVWVYLWLVVPLVGAALGDFWRYLNPWRTLARDGQRSAMPVPADTAGLYPAAFAFAIFMWVGLVPDYGREPGVIAMAGILYGLYIGAAVVTSGREGAFGSFEAFTPHNYLVGAIAPVELDARGAWRWHGWLRRLPTVPLHAGLALFVSVVIGAIVYDGLSAGEAWVDMWGTTRFEEWFGTMALATTIGLVWAGYRAVMWLVARSARTLPASQVAASFAHILVPIGLAYAVTHYFTVIAFEGQLLVSIISDPLGVGSDYFGTARREVTLWIEPIAVWYVQLAVIILGHVAAGALAHDRALALFPKESAVRSQYPILVLIVALASLGLLLLSVA